MQERASIAVPLPDPRSSPWRVTDCRSRYACSYGLAVMSTVTVSAILVALLHTFQIGDEPPAVALTLPILLAAYVGGLGPGLLATAISIVVVGAYDGPRLVDVRGLGPSDFVQFITLVVVGPLISLVCESLHRARQDAEAGAALEHKLGAIVAAAPGAMYSFRLRPDGSTCFPYLSAGFRDMTGIDFDDVRLDAKAAFARAHPDDAAAIHESIARSAQTLSLWRAEFRLQHPTKGEVWISGTSAPTRERDGSILWYGFFTDATERRRADEAVARAQKLEALGTLSGGIAHDFNNMLMAILGNARLASLDLPAGHPVQEALEEIMTAGHRATDLVKQILRFSRPDDPRRDIVALESIVHDAEGLLRPTTPAGIEMQCTAAPDVPPVAADPTLVHQAIVNLTANATHAMGAAGRIDYRVDVVDIGDDASAISPDLRPGRYARLSVSDTGSGMEPPTLARIFDPFFTTKPVGQGTGLGLSVVHGTMRVHRGAVTVRSAPGLGTTFSLYFPAATDADVRASGCSSPAVVAGNARDAAAEVPSAVPLARVLFIDDEPSLVRLAERTLERERYQVFGYTSPDAALSDLSRGLVDCDVVVTDFAMPGLSGLDVAARVRATRPDLPVLLSSGRLTADDEAAIRALGVREIVPKPNTLPELTAALGRLFVSGPTVSAAMQDSVRMVRVGV